MPVVCSRASRRQQRGGGLGWWAEGGGWAEAGEAGGRRRQRAACNVPWIFSPAPCTPVFPGPEPGRRHLPTRPRAGIATRRGRRGKAGKGRVAARQRVLPERQRTKVKSYAEEQEELELKVGSAAAAAAAAAAVLAPPSQLLPLLPAAKPCLFSFRCPNRWRRIVRSRPQRPVMRTHAARSAMPRWAVANPEPATKPGTAACSTPSPACLRCPTAPSRLSATPPPPPPPPPAVSHVPKRCCCATAATVAFTCFAWNRRWARPPLPAGTARTASRSK